MRYRTWMACAAMMACAKEQVTEAEASAPSASAPSASVVASAPASAPPSASTPPPPPSPVVGTPSALFADVTNAKPLPIRVSGCDQVVFTFVKGKGTALGDTLATYDFVLVLGEGNFEIKGDGVLAVGRATARECIPQTSILKKVARASASKDLAWANGTMHARFGLEGDNAPLIYAGRLEGTAPVAEHTHPGSWEILCAYEGAGVFTLDGRPKHLGPREVVVVPPDTKHSWQPDANKKLVAVQMYAPPGPEKRFLKLAADAADAGK